MEPREQAEVGPEEEEHSVGPEGSTVHLLVDSKNSRTTLRVLNVKTHKHTRIRKHICILK